MFSGIGKASDDLKIGVIFAKTGEASQVSAIGFQTTRFAADELNQAGGILGKKIRLMEYDNHSTPIGSRNAAQKAVEDGVIGVIGSVYSSHSIAMSSVLQENRIPMISPASTNPELTVNKDYIFRACYTDDFQGKVMANFAFSKLNAKTAAVLIDTRSRYSQGLARVFVEQFKTRGRILWEGEYQEGDIDFIPQINKIKLLNPDVGFVPGHFRESAYIIKQARILGLSLVFLGGDGWVNQMYIYGGDYIHGNYYATQWHYNSPDPQSVVFVEKFKNAFGTITNEPVMALTYDAFMILAAAIRSAGSFHTPDIRNMLARTSGYKGVTGTITFDGNGDPIDKQAVILKLENHDSIYYQTIDPKK